MLTLVFFSISFIVLAAAEALWPMRPSGDSGRRLATNFLLAASNILLVAAVPIGALAAAMFAEARGIGLLKQLQVPWVLALSGTLLARSLSSYALHRLSHAMPLLWRLHRIHHADREVDLSTALRSHPAEVLVATAAAALWEHANVGLGERWDMGLRSVLTTPAFHVVHHSARRDECDSNFGTLFSLWDRMFGTLRQPKTVERLGLGDAADRDADNLLRQLSAPLRR